MLEREKYRFLSHTDLITAIANGVVHLVASRSQLHLDVVGHDGARNSGSKGMAGMVTVGVGGEACLAKVKVLAILTMEELLLRAFYSRLATSNPFRWESAICSPWIQLLQVRMLR